MDKRDFYVYITPKDGGADRSLAIRCINFGEAEGLAAEHIGENEFISCIVQEFPAKEQ
jgi:hypothetical protein